MKQIITDATFTLIGAAILGGMFLGFMYGMGELMMLLGIA